MSEKLDQTNTDDCANLWAQRDGNTAVPLKCAKLWTDNWKSEHPRGPFSFLFTREEIQSILDEGGSHVRIALGINQAARPDTFDYYKLLVVGVDAELKIENGNLEYYDYNLLGDGDTVQDFAKPCPPFCPKDNQSL